MSRIGVAAGALEASVAAAGGAAVVGGVTAAALLSVEGLEGVGGVGGATSAIVVRSAGIRPGGPFTRKPTKAPAATAPMPMPSAHAIA